MTKTRGLSIVVAILATSIVATPALAHGGKSKFKTNLSGYNETTATINSPASGNFVATVSKDESTITYTLTYSGIPTTVTQAHIHFGRPGLTGGIALFLCSNLGNGPAGTQSCPQSGTVTGTLTAANIVGPAAQGIAVSAAGFADMVKAIRNGSAYANVHSTQFPSGEIRGPLGDPNDDEDDDD
jgi:hypothetical protein